MRGHVRKRGNKWCFVLDVGRNELTGERTQKWFSGYEKKEEAERAMIATIKDLNDGTYVEDTGESFGEFMENWLLNKKNQVRPGSWKSYSWLVNTHLIPHLGKIQLSKLKPIHLNNLYNQKLLPIISANSIKKLHGLVKAALDEGMGWGIVARNVAVAVTPPRVKKVKFEVWDEDQLGTFLEAAKHNRFYIAFELAASTGMRVGEILGLRWRDVDLERKTISVRQAFTKAEKGHDFHEPKTSSGERSIALFLDTVEALTFHFEDQIVEKEKQDDHYFDHGLVVQTHIGTPVNPRNLARAYYAILNSLDLPRIRFHDLRHTHATILLKRGVHPKIVQERLGHSSIQITLDTYSHVLPGLQEAALLTLGGSILGKNDTSTD
ncbi:site-specific integrase [Paenibacillus sp. NFR01]|uniref:site-specific integrase n=2 Tax=Paenibacillus sp. NFR01 TaxID=1566279 RepID=UPI0008BD2FA1|nr:site-specific integrase [Paenibacillus sp. NFR01]SEU32588.1 Site-specific recombinase XerD [Paenibacillus sp. NFR01]